MPLFVPAALLIILSIALTGCASSSLSQFVAQSHSTYEAAYLSGGVSRPSWSEAGRRSPRKTARVSAPERPTERTPVASTPVQRPAVTDPGNTGSVGPPPIAGTGRLLEPKIGSPEWEREEAKRKKRDREVERSMRSICSGC